MGCFLHTWETSVPAIHIYGYKFVVHSDMEMSEPSKSQIYLFLPTQISNTMIPMFITDIISWV